MQTTMRKDQNRIAWIFISTLFLGLVGGCSLSADVTPPANYEQVRAMRETAQAPVMPMTAPSVQMGQQIYARYCTECHGENGLGDGPSALQIPDGVPAFAESSALIENKPTDLFQTITLGGGEMPAFNQMLTAAERWDAIAYLYYLQTSPETVAQGKLIYQANCQTCHGEDGTGGPGTPAWNDPARLAALSNAELVQITSRGTPLGMPPFANKLSPEEIHTAAAYLRAAIFINAEQSQAGNTPVASNSAVITGSVFNITSSQSTGGLPIKLLGLDSATNHVVFSREGTINANGFYRFDNVNVLESRTYVVAVTHQGVPYYSSPIEARELLNNQTVNRPVEVYEASRDVSQLSVARRHIFLDLNADGSLQVMEMLLIENPLKVAVIGSQDDAPVLKFSLPPGATNLQFDDAAGQRFSEVAGGFVDFLPVQPGTVNQVLYVYDLPYRGKLNLTLPVEMGTAQVLVVVPAGRLKVASGQLSGLGQQELNGVNVELFSAAQLEAGSTLGLTVSGRLARGLSLRSGSTSSLGIGLLILGSVMTLGLYLYYRQHKTELGAQAIQPGRTPEDVMDAIITLDDSYQAGKLTESSYQARRAELKERLREILPVQPGETNE